MGEGKGRTDLLPFFALLELSKHFEAGAKKYAAENWRKGIPLRVYLDSAIRHLFKFGLGMRDERHDLAALWNIACLIETQHMIDRGILPPTLGDLPDWYDPHTEPDGRVTNTVEPNEHHAAVLGGPTYREDDKGYLVCVDEGCPHHGTAHICLEYGEDCATPTRDFGPVEALDNWLHDLPFVSKPGNVGSDNPFSSGPAIADPHAIVHLGNGLVETSGIETPDRIVVQAPDWLNDPAIIPVSFMAADPDPYKTLRETARAIDYPLDLREQDRDVTVNGVSYGGHYTRGHATETAERFNAGQPYADNGGFPPCPEKPNFAPYADDLRADELPQQADILAAVEADAAEAIAEHGLFSVVIINGPDAAEYDGPELSCAMGCCVPPPVEPNPLDGREFAVIRKTEPGDARRWLVKNGEVWYSPEDDRPFLKSFQGIETIRAQLAAGYMVLDMVGRADLA
jgi:hypothetical protein